MANVRLTRAALVSAVLGAATMATAQALEIKDLPKGPQEKCYGVAKAGENDCAKPGAHGCATMGLIAYDGQEYVEVPKGTCVQMNGSLKPFEGVNPKIKG